MNKIDLAGLARKKAGAGPKRTVHFRPIHPTQGAVDDLERLIVKAHRQVWTEARKHLLPVAKEASKAMADDEAGRLTSTLKLIRNILASALAGIAIDWTLQRIFEGEEQRHRRRMVEQVKSRVGIDLQHIISRDDLSEAIALSVQKSVSAIQGLNDDVAKMVERKILDAVLAGSSAPALAKILSDSFGWSIRRARLIARDQIASFNGNLNRLRQTQLGIKEYSWKNTGDERVRGNPDGKYPNARPSHWDREGKRFRWDTPPEGGHPGEAVLCRCVGIAILEY